MPSRRLLALLLGVDQAGDAVAELSDGLLDAVVRRALVAGFGDLACGDALAVFQRTLDEWSSSGLQDKPALCRMLYDRLRAGAQVDGVSFDAFEAGFGRFVAALRECLAQETEPQLVDLPCRELGSMSFDELSRMQASDELFHYIAHLVAHLLDRHVIAPDDAEFVIDLVQKMVSAPGYLRFLSENRKCETIARLLDLVMIVRTSAGRMDAALNDMIVTLGLLIYIISPSEKAASGLASARPSAGCPELQYHYHGIMALSCVLTGKLDLASRHAALACGSADDASMRAYALILQGCIAIRQGDRERAAALLEEAGSVAPGGRVDALALFYRGLVFAGAGEYERAIGCFREAGARVTDPLDRATVHGNTGSCAIRLGDLRLAEQSFMEMEKLAGYLDGDSALRCQLTASSHIGALLRARGDYSGAIERFRQALKLALQSGDGKAVANQLGNLGTAYALGGEAGIAIHLLNACMAHSERMAYWPGIRYAYWHIGRVLAEMGNRSEARKFRETYASRYPELRNLG